MKLAASTAWGVPVIAIHTADTTLARNNLGVLTIIQDQSGIGVVAKTRFAAEKTIAAIKVSWTFTPNYTTNDAIT